MAGPTNPSPGVGVTQGNQATNAYQYNVLMQQQAFLAGGNSPALGTQAFGVPIGSSARIWMGTGAPPSQKPQASIPGYMAQPTGLSLPADQAVAYFDHMPDAALARFTQAVAALHGTRRPSVATVQSEWANAVAGAGAWQQYNGEAISPWDYIEKKVQQFSSAGVLPSMSGGSGTSVRVNLTNPTDAKVLVDNALQQYLGRDATKEEQAAFYKALQGQERANPNVTTKSASSGGVNTQEIAKEFAQSRPDYAEYTTDTKFRSYLMSAIAADPTQGMRSGL